MNSRKSLFSLVTLVCVLGAYAGDNSAAVDKGETKEGCRIQLSSDRREYRFGEPIRLTANLENVSRDALSLRDDNPFPYEIAIQAPDLKSAVATQYHQLHTGPGPWDWTEAKLKVFKKGGTQVAYLFPLNREFDMTLGGNYVIRVSRTVRSLLDPEANVTLTSNEVAIRIVDDK